ncbi:Multidrug efflux pump subunit AcrB [Chitinophaga sp. YR627]|uniref:efflux RND transporter permease subunit n=1 Tax=Chitinophaga sp. YR627 TaxID=1881041 RepID=UPI0008EC2386|nr:efflux RND transporter permease subunit [Chitinophaga sp. YR627]SFM59690.1 Multidrug efflux pump subunit AcrB [Chitinophaga sp. YR627]
MVRYFIQRPVGIIMIFIVLVAGGLWFSGQIPVSLLPEIDVPQLTIRIRYPDKAASNIEQDVMQPLRERLSSLDHLVNIESRCSNHEGVLYLYFRHRTRMDLMYIDVNEILDRMTNLFPRDMERPQIIRANTADIPVIRLQVTPRSPDGQLAASDLAEKILKRRLEQLDGISMVDLSGLSHAIIVVAPEENELKALGLNQAVLPMAIQNADRRAGNLSLRDGQYRYLVEFSSSLNTIDQIRQLPLRSKGGTVIKLQDVAKVAQVLEDPSGYHVYNGKKGIVITIQKQPDSRMNELVPAIKTLVEKFKEDYPQLEFAFSRDQTFLLNAGIDNLYQDLIYGGTLTVLLLFMFLGNWGAPVLMSINIPLSLIITFIFFYFLGISFNIISLSGLALGIGMLIDNSIVVINNITRKRILGLNLTESSIQGTNEVVVPVISQVLTTVAVYVPLVIMNGLSGDLIADQSIALSVSMGISLLVAFVLTPVLYPLLMKHASSGQKEDTVFYKWVAAGYHRMIHNILRFKCVYFLITVGLMFVGGWLAMHIPIKSLPHIERTESLIKVDWNEPISAGENLKRSNEIEQLIRPYCTSTETEVGIQQFLMQPENNEIQQVILYFNTQSEKELERVNMLVKEWVPLHYKNAGFSIVDAPNAFTQLFEDKKPYIEARFRYGKAGDLEPLLQKLSEKGLRLAENTQMVPNMTLKFDEPKMLLYGVQRTDIQSTLQELFGTYHILSLKGAQGENSVRLNSEEKSMNQKLQRTVSGANNTSYPLNLFVSMTYGLQPKYIEADKAGVYYSAFYETQHTDVLQLQDSIRNVSLESGFSVDFNGRYFEDRVQLKQLLIVFLVVLLLLYFIMALQYEDLLLPLVVMLTIPLGVTGGLFLLWITGSALDIMAAIGFIVILGLIVDDPILKVETLVRLEKQYMQEGMIRDEQLLSRIIHEAGDQCLKPLLMVSLTTSIALVPVLFLGGIGNDLQRPMALVVIGGLSIGTFFTTWFVPLAYWYLFKWKNKI